VAKEVDLNEDSNAQSGDSRSASENEDADADEDEEMDKEDAGEFFDVLDVFDGRADVESHDDPLPKVDKKLRDIQRKATRVEDEEEWGGVQGGDVGTSGDEDEDEDEDGDRVEGEEDAEEGDSAVDEDDELRLSASDSEDPSPEALADLETFLSNLDPATSHKRKPDDVTEPGPKKRQRVTDRTEAGEESEFGVRGTYMQRYHTSHFLISVQVRVLSSSTTFLLHSHLPLPSLPSRNRRNLSHRPARKRKPSPRHYLSVPKNVSTEKLHTNRRKKRWTNGRPR